MRAFFHDQLRLRARKIAHLGNGGDDWLSQDFLRLIHRFEGVVE